MSQYQLRPAGRTVLCIAGTVQGHKIAVATSHLESPCGSNQMYSKERKAQLRHVSPCSCIKLEFAIANVANGCLFALLHSILPQFEPLALSLPTYAQLIQFIYTIRG